MEARELGETAGAEFEELIAGERPVLAYFYGTWCCSCKAMDQVVEQLAARFTGRAEIVEVNTEGSPALAGRYGVVTKDG